MTWDEIEHELGIVKDRLTALVTRHPELSTTLEQFTLFATTARQIDEESAEGVAFAMLAMVPPLLDVIEKLDRSVVP